MDALYAVGDQVDNLLDGVGDAGVLHGGRVVAVAVHDTHKLFGQAGAAQRDHPLDLLAVGHRHDASLHRHGDARLAHPVEKAVKVVVVKEKLGDQVSGTGVHLLFQVLDVLLQVPGLRVHLGVAGGGDVEAAVPLDLPDQVAGVAVVGLRRDVGVEIPAQGQNVFHLVLAQVVQHQSNVLPGRVDAGQMSQRLDVVLVLDGRGDLHRRAVGGVAARAVGDADKVRGDVGQGVKGVVDGLNRGGLFGRENLQRKDDLLLVEQCLQFHGLMILSGFYYTNLKNDLLHYSEKVPGCKGRAAEKGEQSCTKGACQREEKPV